MNKGTEVNIFFVKYDISRGLLDNISLSGFSSINNSRINWQWFINYTDLYSGVFKYLKYPQPDLYYLRIYIYCFKEAVRRFSKESLLKNFDAWIWTLCKAGNKLSCRISTKVHEKSNPAWKSTLQKKPLPPPPHFCCCGW